MKLSWPRTAAGPTLSRTFVAVGVATLLVGAAAAAVSTASASGKATAPTTGACASAHVTAPTRITTNHRVAVVMRPHVTRSAARSASCASAPGAGKDDLAVGAPPLYFWGGNVMGTPSVHNKIVVTPIYWQPSGYSFVSGYQQLINQYLAGVAHDSGKNNVFATNTEYAGRNGAVHDNIQFHAAITDTTALPSPECTFDPHPVYSDGSSYTACVDDDQVQAEISQVVSSHSLPSDYGHIYVLFLPKKVESCFYSDAQAATVPGGNQCTIDSTPRAAYCAYHSSMASQPGEIYANMPYPVYQSADGYSCTDEHLDGDTSSIQSPNGNPDADVEVSPTSHEMSEAFTDPNGNAWYDAVGYENGDECAYVYGKLGGPAGKHYNQTINGHHYLTQEEFSDNDFYATYGNGGCLQGEPRPMVFSTAPTSGSKGGGTVVTVRGADFTPTSSVLFGTTPGKNVKYVNAGTLKVTAPKHKAGTVNVFVRTLGGTSAVSPIGRFTYK